MDNEKIAHDLRNSLTVIKGNLDLIHFSAESSTNRKFLDEAKTELNHLKTLIEQMEK